MMSQRGEVDLVFIGLTNASLVAAGCAAKVGARVVIIKTGYEEENPVSNDRPSNAVWRLLGLFENDVKIEPLEALVSVQANTNNLFVREDQQLTRANISLLNEEASLVWGDYLDVTKQFSDASLESIVSADEKSVFRKDKLGNGLISSDLITANDLLDDFFDDERIKSHLSSLSLMQFGLAGDEPGSVVALGSGFSDANWRVKTSSGTTQLRKVLLQICAETNVTVVTADIIDVTEGKRNKCVVFENDEEIGAKFVIAADTTIAQSLGLEVETGGSPLVRRNQTCANISILLSADAITQLDNVRNTVHYLSLNGRETLLKARDAVAEGKIPETLPSIFELSGRTIHVSVPYLPVKISTESELRDWSGQDRQALGNQVLEQVLPHLDYSRAEVEKISVSIAPLHGRRLLARKKPLQKPIVLAPAPHHNRIESLVALTMKAIGHG